MKQLNEFSTLAEAQDYFIIQNVTKNNAINHDAVYGVEEILTQVMTENPNDQIKVVARVFNRIIGGALESTNIMDDVAQSALTALVNHGSPDTGYTQEMRDHIESFAKVYPFANTTQEEFDLAKLQGESVATITYSGGDKLVTAGGQYFAFHATLDTPAPKDTKVTVTAKSSKGEGSAYVPISQKWQFTIKQGETGFNDINIPVRGLDRWVQFEATLDTASLNCTIDCVRQ